MLKYVVNYFFFFLITLLGLYSRNSEREYFLTDTEV